MEFLIESRQIVVGRHLAGDAICYTVSEYRGLTSNSTRYMLFRGRRMLQNSSKMANSLCCCPQTLQTYHGDNLLLHNIARM